MKTPNTPPHPGLSIVRYINGNQIAPHAVAQLTVTSPAISELIHGVNRRIDAHLAPGAIAQEDSGGRNPPPHMLS